MKNDSTSIVEYVIRRMTESTWLNKGIQMFLLLCFAEIGAVAQELTVHTTEGKVVFDVSDVDSVTVASDVTSRTIYVTVDDAAIAHGGLQGQIDELKGVLTGLNTLVSSLQNRIATLEEGVKPQPSEPEVEEVDMHNGHRYVDMGLSVLWATCNVGAEDPEDYGYYYSWGETAEGTTYSWTTYTLAGGSKSKLNKYNATDGKTVLDMDDDAARTVWGGEWRMPTRDEMKELRAQCTWSMTTMNGVTVCQVKAPNGNSIYLPAAGYKLNGSIDAEDEEVEYWTSTVDGKAWTNSYTVGVLAGGSLYEGTEPRCTGLPIRPVLAKEVVSVP